MDILSMSSSKPRCRRTLATASLMMDKVFSPRKSILISPVSSMTEPSYWVTSIFSPVSLSSAVLTGTQSVMSSRQIIVPQACTPVPRTLPSSILAYFIVSRTSGSGEASAACNSGTYAIAFGRLSFLSGILSGTSLHRRSDSLKGSFCTRATSLIAILVAIVPYVMMCATFSCPYFSVTQRSTSPRPSSSKSTSISGKEIRSGFKKRSNRRSY